MDKKIIFLTLFKWKLNKQDLQYQVDNYKSLNIFSSARKLSATIILLFMLPSVFLLYLIATEGEGLPIEIIITVIGIILLDLLLIVLIYKGNRVAIIIMMIIWTLDKVVQLLSGVNFFIVAAFWAIVMTILTSAYEVEQARRVIK